MQLNTRMSGNGRVSRGVSNPEVLSPLRFMSPNFGSTKNFAGFFRVPVPSRESPGRTISSPPNYGRWIPTVAILRCWFAAMSFDGEMSSVVAQFNELRFSPDGRLVYFETPAWATSGALHMVDTTTCREHFICAGGIESFRGNNLVVVETVLHSQRSSVSTAITHSRGPRDF
jgi:hypothetical protein